MMSKNFHKYIETNISNFEKIHCPLCILAFIKASVTLHKIIPMELLNIQTKGLNNTTTIISIYELSVRYHSIHFCVF